jgi:hypothetical protein
LESNPLFENVPGEDDPRVPESKPVESVLKYDLASNAADCVRPENDRVRAVLPIVLRLISHRQPNS